MIRNCSILLLAVFWLFVNSCKPSGQLDMPADHWNRLYQFSVIPALQRGVFDDDTFTSGALRKHGTIGLGTFNALDGELILLNDTVYQARFDGNVTIASDSSKIPFAVACFLKPDTTLYLDVTGQQDLYQQLAKNLSPNYMYAIHCSGIFDSMTVRSVKAQTQPYPMLSAATASQAVFNWANLSGEVVGLFSPQYMAGVNVPGYHAHFISTDRKHGGHILRFTSAKLKVHIARVRAVNIEFPASGAFNMVNLFDIDPNDIHKAEK
jgi:acetolactate decarboxylase